MATPASHTWMPPRRRRPRLLAWTLAAAALWLGWPVVRPALEIPLYGLRLAAMPAPSRLPVPVEGVRPRDLRDTWNAPRADGRHHEGIDIFARRNTAVLSATEGIVTRIGTNTLGGNTVWVMGPGRQMHYYAHLERYADLRAGQRIQAGMPLGYVGNSGNARGTPTHLHYGIYEAGGAINPYPLLAGR
ncbi:MAG: M23 family metallopeptidase [Pigmentiphaga sp.]|uniref:M23 family metallopeptidase n=1 Tax=Pigmentiphaga sp. TaxID=1977564 RepID=UPI003B5361D9